MIDPLRIFRLYLGIKIHFTTEKYDVIKSNCKVKNSNIDVFNKRRDCKPMIYFSAQFKTIKEASSYFIANFAYGNDYPFEDWDKFESLYKEYKKVKESLTYHFSNDIVFITEYMEEKNCTFEQLLGTDSNSVPMLWQMFLAGKLKTETLTLLNKVYGFIPQWQTNHKLWNADFIRIKKLESFIKWDETKINSILIEKGVKV